MPSTQLVASGYISHHRDKRSRKQVDRYWVCEHKRHFPELPKHGVHKRRRPIDLFTEYGLTKPSLRAARQRALARQSLEREFTQLTHRWRNETAHLSIASEKANNFAYQQIVGMGEKVLPLIFRELENTTSDWFWALRAIAREKAPPIPEEVRGRVRRIAEIWMDWGKKHGYVSR